MPPVLSRFLLSLLLMVPTPASAQTSPLISRQSTLQELSDSQWIRLVGPGLGRREGKLLAHSPVGLELVVDEQRVRVPATSIDTLWTRGRATKLGAVIFGALGTAAGVIVATQAVEKGESPGADWIALFGVGGAVGGGLLGALFGSSLPRWERQYPR